MFEFFLFNVELNEKLSIDKTENLTECPLSDEHLMVKNVIFNFQWMLFQVPFHVACFTSAIFRFGLIFTFLDTHNAVHFL